jgi:hypothetical protein
LRFSSGPVVGSIDTISVSFNEHLIMNRRSILALSAMSFLAPTISGLAAEHPQPIRQTAIQAAQQATPARPSVQTQQVTNADISAGIKKNIATAVKRSRDKKFHVKHQGKDLALDLVTVHDDRLSNLANGKYFACVDMKAADSTAYDIDFFLAGQPGAMKVTQTSVHKINGKPLYDWKEDKGVWRQVKKS